MKSFIKTSLIVMAIASLVGCSGVTSEIKEHPYSIDNVSLSPLPDESGVSLDEFNKAASNVTKHEGGYIFEYYYQFHETLVGSWALATDINNNPLPDGSDIYGAASITGESTNGKSMHEVEKKNDSNLPSLTMRNYVSIIQPNNLSSCEILRDSFANKEQYEDKFFLNPLRMCFKYAYTKVGYVEGYYYETCEWDFIFREDGFIKICIFKKTIEVDGIVAVPTDPREPEPEPVYCKGTHTFIYKLEADYTFNE